MISVENFENVIFGQNFQNLLISNQNIENFDFCQN